MIRLMAEVRENFSTRPSHLRSLMGYSVADFREAAQDVSLVEPTPLTHLTFFRLSVPRRRRSSPTALFREVLRCERSGIVLWLRVWV